MKKIVITGCGYSYAAGISAKYIFETIAKVPAEVPFSIDASRHLNLKLLPTGKETMFIGVSNSGIVARIAEAMERLKRHGAMTVAFTGASDSKCGKQADYIVDTSCPALEHSLPLRGYIMTLLNCYSIAWSMAIAKEYGKEEDRIRFFQSIKSLAANAFTSASDRGRCECICFPCKRR